MGPIAGIRLKGFLNLTDLLNLGAFCKYDGLFKADGFPLDVCKDNRDI